MRFHTIAFVLLSASSQAVSGFTSSTSSWSSRTQPRSTFFLASTTEDIAVTTSTEAQTTTTTTSSRQATPLTEKEINARLGIQLNKMQAKDSTSLQLTKEVSQCQACIQQWRDERMETDLPKEKKRKYQLLHTRSCFSCPDSVSHKKYLFSSILMAE